jgi:regulator of replication initiation timing
MDCDFGHKQEIESLKQQLQDYDIKNGKLEREKKELKQQLQEELGQDKLKGYPTVIEWKKMIEKIKARVKDVQ